MQIDDNLEVSASGAIVSCTHCATVVGECTDEPLGRAIRRELPATAAGAVVRAAPARFTGRPIVLRQLFCPGCATLLGTEIVPQDEPSYRTWRLEG